MLIKIAEPQATPTNTWHIALWDLGFRPFFLLAGMFAALSIALWAAQFAGRLPYAYLKGPAWHAHEMLFGYTLAVIVGFLFTATRNWTRHQTPTGRLLMMFVLMWLAARVLVLTSFGWAAAVTNTLFPVAVAFALAVPLIKARNRRNYFFVVLLLMIACLSVVFHATQLGIVELPTWLSVQLVLDVVLFIMVVMGGRVIPVFTVSGVPGTQLQPNPLLNFFALGAVVLVLIADCVPLHGVPYAILLMFGALVHAFRLFSWQPWRTFRTPLVWVLHVAYAWIAVHLLLRGVFELGLTSLSVATHALTVGAIGTLTLGMMTRTAKGHTGRTLKADRFDVACYTLVTIAACVRIFVPMWMPASLMQSVVWSAFLWSCAFGLFAVRYWSILIRQRVDGKPG